MSNGDVTTTTEATTSKTTDGPDPSTVVGAPIDRLIRLIKLGDAVLVKKMITDDPTLMTTVDTKDGAYPAHWAALYGQLAVLDVLQELDGKLDVVVEKTGMAPIHWAASKGALQSVRYLVMAGYDINSRMKNGQTPFMLAAQANNVTMLNWMLLDKCDKLAVDNDGDTAVHWAAYKNSYESLCVLYNNNLDMLKQDRFGSIPLHLAVSQNNKTCVDYMIALPEGDAMREVKDAKGFTPEALANDKKLEAMAALFDPANKSSPVGNGMATATAGVIDGMHNFAAAFSNFGYEVSDWWNGTGKPKYMMDAVGKPWPKDEPKTTSTKAPAPAATDTELAAAK